MFEALVEKGVKATDAPKFEKPDKHDPYMFSYTSGTTGDSKGVKMTHENILRGAITESTTSSMQEGDAYLSYLPAPHAFEQVMFTAALVERIRCGFYSGDPLKLIEDC